MNRYDHFKHEKEVASRPLDECTSRMDRRSAVVCRSHRFCSRFVLAAAPFMRKPLLRLVNNRSAIELLTNDASSAQKTSRVEAQVRRTPRNLSGGLVWCICAGAFSRVCQRNSGSAIGRKWIRARHEQGSVDCSQSCMQGQMCSANGVSRASQPGRAASGSKTI